MVFRKVFLFYLSVFFISTYSFAQDNEYQKLNSDSVLTKSDTVDATSHKTINNDSVNIENTDTIEFSSLYYEYLDKADWAYSLGIFGRAEKYYKKAFEINPRSEYIKYRINEIDQYSKNLSNIVFFFNFDKPGILIQAITFFIIYFIFSMLIILLIILANRQRMEKIEKRKQSLREVYQELLVDFLFSEQNNEPVIQKFKKVISTDFNRKILINQMIDLSINLTGDAKEKLRNLYISLALDKDSVAKAYSSKWHIKVKGFHELAFMDITDANDEIIRCLSSNNNIVRMEAQLALVRLNHEDSFDFLEHLEKPFTLWEQLTIYETIMFHNLPIPQFDRWLFSKNKSVVLFAIRMIDIFRQKETYPNLFWMLVNEDEEIRYEVIKVIGNLRVKDALPHLKRLYKTESYKNCLAIIIAIGKMADESVLNFLKLVLDKEEDVQLQIEAAIAINNAGEAGKLALEKLLTSDYKNYQIIIKHVLDKRIL